MYCKNNVTLKSENRKLLLWIMGISTPRNKEDVIYYILGFNFVVDWQQEPPEMCLSLAKWHWRKCAGVTSSVTFDFALRPVSDLKLEENCVFPDALKWVFSSPSVNVRLEMCALCHSFHQRANHWNLIQHITMMEIKCCGPNYITAVMCMFGIHWRRELMLSTQEVGLRLGASCSSRMKSLHVYSCILVV